MKKILDFVQKKTVRLVLATVLISLGVFFSFPEKGLVATLPLSFLFYVAAGLVFPDARLLLLAPPVISFFFGKSALLPDPFLYGAFHFVTSLFAYLSSFSLLRLKKRKLLSLLLAASLAAGLFLPTLYLGTPAAWQSAREAAEGYLAEHYPDQKFARIRLHRNTRDGSYRVLASYATETGTLTSTLTFSEDGVEDGFFKDTTAFMMEKRKSDLIRTFHRISASVITEGEDVLSEKKGSVLSGSYGQVDESVIEFMHYSVTLREEKPQRREFAEECARLLAALQEDGVTFGRISFFGLDAGNVVHRLDVDYSTPADPETLLSLVVNP